MLRTKSCVTASLAEKQREKQREKQAEKQREKQQEKQREKQRPATVGVSEKGRSISPPGAATTIRHNKHNHHSKTNLTQNNSNNHLNTLTNSSRQMSRVNTALLAVSHYDGEFVRVSYDATVTSIETLQVGTFSYSLSAVHTHSLPLPSIALPSILTHTLSRYRYNLVPHCTIHIIL